MPKKKKPTIGIKLRKIHKNKHVRRHAPWSLLPIGLLLGFVFARGMPANMHPESLVWAASNNVKVPADLENFLEGEPTCLDDKGNRKTDGVSLWSIYDVSQSKFAKLAYGCSYDLSFYKMAVKQDKKWRLLDAKDYLANNFLPKCSEVEKYRIDKSIEPFCIESSGASKENPILAQ